MADRTSVCVVGLGYIGLPTAATIAGAGHRVIGVDTNPAVVETISAGQIHIVESGLADLVLEGVQSGMLRAESTPEPADTFLICVPTPLTEGGMTPTPDIGYVLSAAQSIAAILQPGNLVVLESTCPVGTTERVREELAEAGAPVNSIRLAYCPERVLPGRMLYELVANDRIIGGIDPVSAEAAKQFYATFVRGALLITDSRTAEMVKLVENSFRDVNIAFANEISVLSDHLAIDPWTVIELANRHPRVQILQPGPGVGGHCIAVDPWFIVAQDPETARLTRMARQVNDEKTDWVVQRISERAARLTIELDRPARVACLGLSYKADVDDLRESPAVRITLALVARGIDVLACEPHISDHPLLVLVDAATAVAEADLVAVLVRHAEFGELDLTRKLVLDFCGLTVGSPTP